jgi:CO/xanthine dehydrogenase Mo-binding subunit
LRARRKSAAGPASRRPQASGHAARPGRASGRHAHDDIKYELVRTYVAVNRRTGAVQVQRFYVACGQVINPDGLKNQIEGNVMQTVSRTLIEA